MQADGRLAWGQASILIAVHVPTQYKGSVACFVCYTLRNPLPWLFHLVSQNPHSCVLCFCRFLRMDFCGCKSERILGRKPHGLLSSFVLIVRFSFSSAATNINIFGEGADKQPVFRYTASLSPFWY